MPKTRVTFLLDKSGSMQKIKTDTMGAFNAYLSGLKKSKANIIFSLIQFDTISIETTYKNFPIEAVPELGDYNYKPQGMTPLIDAAYKTIKAVEEVAQKKDKIVICIQTDGLENASTQYTMGELNELIKVKSAIGWQFNFMGVGIDAYNQGHAMGIATANTVSYDPTRRATTEAAFFASASNTADFALGVAATTAYSSAQKSASGDAWEAVNKKLDAAKAISKSQVKRQAAKKLIVDDVDLT